VTYGVLILSELIIAALRVVVSFGGCALVVVCDLNFVRSDFSLIIPTTLAAVSVSHDFQFNI
jgi:hypothetical protein